MLPELLARAAFRLAGHVLTVHDALCLAAAAALPLLGLWVLRKERMRQAALVFFLLTGSAALWIGGLALVRSAPDAGRALDWARVALVGFTFAPALLYHFSFELLDEPEDSRGAGGLLWLLAACVAAAGLATDRIIEGVVRAPWGYQLQLTPEGIAATAALGLLAVGGSVQEHLGVFRGAAPGSQRQEIGTYLVAFALGGLALVDVLPELGVAVYPFGYLAVTAALGLAAHALRRYQLSAYRPDVAAREILESVGDPLLVVDGNREIHFANYAASQLFGFGRREFPGMSLETLTGSGEAGDLAELTRKDLVQARQRVLRTAAGESVEVSVTASPLSHQGDDRAGTVLVIRDISERLEAERQLRESEERYALAARGANDGLWDWDLRADRVHYSERWAEMLGLEADELTDDPSEWLERIHDDDRDRVRAEIAAHLHGDAPHVRTEYRIRHADGEWRWMLCRGMAVRGRGGTGEPVRLAGSQRDVTDLRRTRERLQHETRHDELTGLPNRSHLVERLEECLEAFREDPARLFALLHLDLDRFARINETYGHSAGDDVLSEVAGRLEEVAGGRGDLLARLSGDEFALLLAGIEGAEEAVEAAVRVDELMEETAFRVEGRDVHLTVTAGATVARSDYERPDQVLRDAEIAMNAAKSDERRGFALFRPSMRKMPANRLALESDLRRALDRRDELALEYQPIVEFAGGVEGAPAGRGAARLVAVEALVRWNHPDRGRLGAGAFVPVAEEVGLAAELGRWVVRESCRQMARWRRELGERAPGAVHVNLSPDHIADRSTVEFIREVLEAEGLPGDRLDVEITEQALVSRPDAVARSLEAIRELGVGVAIDDFGTGHASFGHLRRFPADMVKVDREFVDPVAHSRRDREIVRSILEVAGSLELEVVTEGVESREQVDALARLGVRLGQGYFWSRPLAPERLAREIGPPEPAAGER
jgi:diguanylate cyclase (GGDEF)-like protein/PAS domain S-box-containing protein